MLGHGEPDVNWVKDDLDEIKDDLKGSKSTENLDVRTDHVEFRPRRTDEYTVNFSNTTDFAVDRWGDIREAIKHGLSPGDQKLASKCSDREALAREIDIKHCDPESSTTAKRQLGKVTQLPKVMGTLAYTFRALVAPRNVDLKSIWGIIYCNLRISYSSAETLKRASEILSKMRRSLELFNRSLDACDEPNESRIILVDFLDCMVTILLDMNKYLHDCLSGLDPEAALASFNHNVTTQFSELDQSVKHVNEIAVYSKVNRERKIKHLFKTHELRSENEEEANFPNFILAERNAEFWGRQDELNLIMKHLDPNQGNEGLKTYMIYGLRGVGKTEIALEFAHNNLKPHGVYDAVFWIQCETTVSIRQSFTEVAVSLNLRGADRHRHHEENSEEVHKWLKRTSKRWLLIFDNAENEATLQGYMPVGMNGSILMTSRRYFNFAKDMCRGGATVKQFDEEQSWGLLLNMLGEDWKKKVESPVEMEAAKSMLRQLEGLALGIQQTAVLVKDPEIGGASIEETYRKFRDRIETLPERHLSKRSTSEKALDALWDITFNALTPEARMLIGVLAWLSPDRISIELFLPRDQSALDGQLDFCKQDAKDINKHNRASLFSLITPSPGFDRAMNELLKRRLISRDGRYIKIHRVVQEATNYHSIEELQKAFATASKLVFQQFPNRRPNEPLYRKWNICREYIPHAIHLRMAYSKYSRTGKLKVMNEFVELMSNSGWYLYELGDYTATSLAATIGLQACVDKESLVCAELQLIDGCHHYELNQLAECRKSWEESLRVRLKCLDKDHPRLAAIYHNLGNLEVAMGNLDEADEYYTLSMNIWLAGGDNTAEQLAVTYLCIGRFHMLQRNFEEALRYTRLSEALFVRTIGTEMGFMAHVYYAYGNIDLLQKKYTSAWRSYNACLKVALANMPIHPLTASAWFSLGITEFAQGNSELSLYLLQRAKNVAQLRSPTTTDGATARILYHLGRVIESDPTHQLGTLEEAKDLKRQAEMAKVQILAANQGREVLPSEEDEDPERREEVGYDILVPLFFR